MKFRSLIGPLFEGDFDFPDLKGFYMAEWKGSDDFVIFFAPENWSAVTKFRQFLGPPFAIDRELVVGCSAAENHIRKFRILAGLANRLIPTLDEDENEIEQKGHTPAIRSKEFAALIEALYCELYSTLDGIRRTLHSIYKTSGVKNKSTEQLFKKASENKYKSQFPQTIRDALTQAYASWFPRLRAVRTEVTHGDIGSCHKDKKTEKIAYMHGQLGSPTHALVIDDVIGELNQLMAGVESLLTTVFDFLFAQLAPVEHKVMCGFHKGRMYQRTVKVSADLTINSGRCLSRSWFEKETELQCPLRMHCGAYQDQSETK